jgi:formate hydrogenlyase subunit 3/multisubunit Na+/H+ antiporter MnhD subunit
MSEFHILHALLAIAGLWVLLGLLGLTASRNVRFVARTLFPLGAIAAAALAILALLACAQPPQSLVLPLGLPDLPMHLRVDPLSAFFLFLLGLASTGVSLFAAGYFRSGEGTAPAMFGAELTEAANTMDAKRRCGMR